eukprot:TRINITY_DN32514_c0_g1_i1.p1 TRINITY_DN32514_c0_g1~~TRINITY_DN32514_c0_g1_i1.p1  ORF type:complete len:510 (+),score=161.65 TRINITY_DN32514_c0_g1_i1:136-1665(+)
MAEFEIEVDADSHLPVPVSELVESTCRLLADRGSDAADTWRRMSDNLSVVVAVYYDTVTSRVRAAYEAPPAVARAQGLELLSGVTALLEASQFRPLTQEQWDRAEGGQFEFNFPVECMWEKLDADFLRGYYNKCCGGKYLDTGESVPDFAQYALVFTRGVDEVSKTDLFIVEKLNILVESLWAKALSCFRRNTPQQTTRQAGSGSAKRAVCRITVEDVCRHEGILNVFLKKIVIKEPVFQHVAVVYRVQPSRKQSVLEKVSEKLRKGKSFRPSKVEIIPRDLSTSERLIKMELYDRVPFGDLDAVLPEKQINLRPFDSLKFAILVVVGVIVVLVALGKVFFVRHEQGVLPLIVLFVITAVKEVLDLIKGWKMTRFEYTNKVQEYQQRRQVAAGMPVVSQLVDDVKGQELKEMLLGYFFLWRHTVVDKTEPYLTLRALDTMVEDYLEREYGISRDFEVDDALRKLESVGLVRCTGGEGEDAVYQVAQTPEQWMHARDATQFTELMLRHKR